VAGQGATFHYMAHVAAHGFVFVHSLWGGDLWGKEATDALIDQAIAWASAQGIDTTKVGLIGGSGGTFPMTNYWRRHRDTVGAMWLIVPGVHHAHVYDDHPSLQPQMDGQFAGDFKTNAAVYSPISFAAELAGPEPLLISWADDDTAVRDADIEAFAAAAQAEIQINTATGDHGDIGDYDVDVRQVVAAYEELR
jgi:dienelactone hydrolase